MVCFLPELFGLLLTTLLRIGGLFFPNLPSGNGFPLHLYYLCTVRGRSLSSNSLRRTLSPPSAVNLAISHFRLPLFSLVCSFGDFPYPPPSRISFLGSSLAFHNFRSLPLPFPNKTRFQFPHSPFLGLFSRFFTTFGLLVSCGSFFRPVLRFPTPFPDLPSLFFPPAFSPPLFCIGSRFSD